MATRYVTCPETAHLERIEYDIHSFGTLVTACTRFDPPCSVNCPRTCAARLDRKRKTDEQAALDSLGVGDDTGVIALRSSARSSTG